MADRDVAKVTQEDNNLTVDLTDWLIMHDALNEDGDAVSQSFGDFCDKQAARHREAATLEGIRIGLEAAAEAARGTNADLCKTASQAYRIMLGAIRALDPATVLADNGSKDDG